MNINLITLMTAGISAAGAALAHRPVRTSRHRMAAVTHRADKANGASRSQAVHWLALLCAGVSVAVIVGGYIGLIVGLVVVTALRRWLQALPAADLVAQ